MKGTWLVGIVIVVIVLIAASCSHAPRLERQTDQVANFRSQYLQHHPDDPFKKQILNGEVHKEMSFMQVLAAWGLPNVRKAVNEQGSETWGYFARDEHSKKVKRYDLVFVKNSLVNWMVSDDLEMGVLTPEDLTGLPVISTTTMSSGLGSLEQKP